MDYAQIKREIARCAHLRRLYATRAILYAVELGFVWLPDRLGFKWAHRLADNLRTARDESRYAREEFGQNLWQWKRLAAKRERKRTLPVFEGTLQEAMIDCNCKTWEDAMRALVAGAVDFDDQEELVFRCGEVADLSAHKRDDGMPWSEAIGVALEWFCGTKGTEAEDAAAITVCNGGPCCVARGQVAPDRWWLVFERGRVLRDIVLCGQISDEVIRGEVPTL